MRRDIQLVVRRELRTLDELAAALLTGEELSNTVIVALDCTSDDVAIAGLLTASTILVGCAVGPAVVARASILGVLLLPKITGLPFDMFRTELYRARDLYAFDAVSGNSQQGVDAEIFAWADARRLGGTDLIDLIAMRIHDASIDEAFERALVGRNVVAIMGGHRLRRSSLAYREIAVASWQLAQTRTSVVLSGGGPGAMEAANLGARAAHLSLNALIATLELFQVSEFVAPTRLGPGGWIGGNTNEWLADAIKVRTHIDSFVPFGDRSVQSVAVPTWFYGHEPTNVFAHRIAKYFANSIREDGLLAVATSGVIYAEGGPGTLQEVFQDAAQNAYSTFGPASPMVFLDSGGAWTKDPTRNLVLVALRSAAGDSKWGELVFVASTGAEAAAHLKRHLES